MTSNGISWKHLFIGQTVVAVVFVVLYIRQSIQFDHFKRPQIIETNVIVTNVTTTVEVVTNVIVTNEIVNRVVHTNLIAKPPAPATNTYYGTKVVLKGYNVLTVGGMKYAHAVVQNITPVTVPFVRVTFHEYGLNRRGKFLIGSVSDNKSSLGPYQYWEMRKPIDRRALQLEFVDLTTGN